ncbi:hypothetical protein EBB07_28865 [Paenibacillaceae bacterium]|nr:hypothetical protein EBB07_28865 [Paenibacillaceae bacterium]
MNYDQLLEEWEQSRENFLDFMIHVCGLPVDSKTYKDLDRTINNIEDIKKWGEFFDGDIENITATTESFLTFGQREAI